jgi:hypothetical protein
VGTRLHHRFVILEGTEESYNCKSRLFLNNNHLITRPRSFALLEDDKGGRPCLLCKVGVLPSPYVIQSAAWNLGTVVGVWEPLGTNAAPAFVISNVAEKSRRKPHGRVAIT